MTIEEAIAMAQIPLGCEQADEKTKEFARVCISALEKQIPKKPIEIMDEIIGYFWCPNCKNNLGYKHPYCDTCGKKIDWDEE